jgi:hypothetical protein
MAQLAAAVRSLSLPSNRRVLCGALAFGATIALCDWLQQPPPARALLLADGVVAEGIDALLMTLAALMADQAIRDGCSVWRAYIVALPCALLITVGLQVQWFTWVGFVRAGSAAQLSLGLATMTQMCLLWGMAMLVFLNQRSAARMLGGIRAGELERVQLERRLIDSRLLAAQEQFDPDRVMQHLREIRACYAQAAPAAEEQLESLIESLRGSISPQTSVPRPPPDPLR